MSPQRSMAEKVRAKLRRARVLHAKCCVTTRRKTAA
jgi:hypothetical protein